MCFECNRSFFAKQTSIAFKTHLYEGVYWLKKLYSEWKCRLLCGKRKRGATSNLNCGGDGNGLACKYVRLGPRCTSVAERGEGYVYVI